jgi:hypothetical protein
MKTKQSPCKDCILIAVCRHKEFRQLINDCSLLLDLWHDSRYLEDMTSTQSILKPTQWRIKETMTYGGIITVKSLSHINLIDGTETKIPTVYNQNY